MHKNCTIAQKHTSPVKGYIPYRNGGAHTLKAFHSLWHGLSVCGTLAITLIRTEIQHQQSNSIEHLADVLMHSSAN